MTPDALHFFELVADPGIRIDLPARLDQRQAAHIAEVREAPRAPPADLPTLVFEALDEISVVEAPAGKSC